MKKLAPILIAVAAGLIVVLLMLLKPEPEEVTPERPATKVEILTVQPETVQLSVRSQGTILPKVESELAVEVAGRIVAMSPDFRVGRRFTEGDVLFRIDPADYEAAVAARAAELANAELALAQENALAEQAEADWEALGQGEASDLTLRKPQLKQAHALVESAEAALNKAERDLRRTEVRAPYDGLVLTQSVDLGQYVLANSSVPVARIYATDTAELRLPVTQEEMTYLTDPPTGDSPVRIYKDGKLLRTGHLVRFDATIDPMSRLLYAIAEIENPFQTGTDQPPLRRGLFVDAEIEGRQVEQAYVIPRYALRGSNSVYLKTEEDTLVTRTVEILKSDEKEVIITGGLEPGDQVATSPIAYFVENMPVEVIND